jgi:hypothetical protein
MFSLSVVKFSNYYYYLEALYNSEGRVWVFQLVFFNDDATQTPKGKSYTLMISHREKNSST